MRLMNLLGQKKDPSQSIVQLAGPTDAEVLASDLRLRRSLAGSKTNVTGGLAGSQARITMPTLVGT